MAETNKIFVILDPTTMEQPSLVMAESIAANFKARGNEPTGLHVYCCIDEKTIRAKNDEDLDELRAEARDSAAEWVDRIVGAQPHARRYRRDGGRGQRRLAQGHRHGRRAAALRARNQGHVAADAADAPVPRPVGLAVAARHGVPGVPRQNVAESTRSATYSRRSSTGRRSRCTRTRTTSSSRRRAGLQTGLGADLHVVTAYKDNFNYPDRQKFADRCKPPAQPRQRGDGLAATTRSPRRPERNRRRHGRHRARRQARRQRATSDTPRRRSSTRSIRTCWSCR